MKALFSVFFSLILLCGCAGPSSVRREAALPSRTPAALVFDREIALPVVGIPLRHPSSIVTDYRGDSYLCDQGNNRIVKFNAQMLPVSDRGGYGSQAGLFNEPRAIAVDNQLNLWICDAGNRRLVRLDGNLNFVDELPFSDADDPTKLGVPSGIAATTYGELWVSDPDRDRVVVIDNVGQFSKFVGDFGSPGGPVKDPAGIMIDGDDLFYVCDGGNSRVIVYDSYGSDIRTLEDDELVQPLVAALDRRRQVWVLDGASRRLFCFDAAGKNLAPGGLTMVGGEGIADPAGLTIVSDTLAVISDAGSDRLVICKLLFE